MMCSGLPTMTESSGHVTDMCSHVYVETASQQWICKNSSPHRSCFRDTQDHRIEEEITAELEGAELWAQLKQHQNEMVVGPQGRRMFPNFNVRLSGLSPTKFYHVFIEARPIDNHKFTFNNQTKSWLLAGSAETESNKRIYYHPETPLQGSGWMRKPISFKTPKFTTGQQEGNMIEIKKGQKYILVLHLVEISDDRSRPNKCLEFVFDETEFVTVSCHQNQIVAATKMNRDGRVVVH